MLTLDGDSAVVRGNAAFVNVGTAHSIGSGLDPGDGQLDLSKGGTLFIHGTVGFGAMLMGRSGQSSGIVRVSGVGSRIDVIGNTAASQCAMRKRKRSLRGVIDG